MELTRRTFFPAALAVVAAGSGGRSFGESGKRYLEEWVYKVKWGYQEEWLQIFKKYQVAILARQKELGYVTDYTIYAPSLHTSEDARWDYRVILTRSAQEPPPGQAEDEVAEKLFPDRAAFKAEEKRRWEITEVHWDLPIHVVSDQPYRD